MIIPKWLVHKILFIPTPKLSFFFINFILTGTLLDIDLNLMIQSFRKPL